MKPVGMTHSITPLGPAHRSNIGRLGELLKRSASGLASKAGPGAQQSRCRVQVSSLNLSVALMIGLGATFAAQRSSEAGVIRVTPRDNWCALVNAAAPGDEIVFAAGDYTSPCWISARGASSAWVTMRSESTTDGSRARFVYAGSTSNILEIRPGAAYLRIRGFAFGPSQAGVDAIRIRQVTDLVIEDNVFSSIGGISIAANDSGSESARLLIRGNTFRDLRGTGIYLGCHEGNCKVRDTLIEGNFFDGVTSDGVGYAVQIKLNSYATIRDNTIYRPQGPGIMVYGSTQGDTPSVIEGNYVEGSRTDGGVVVGGGPAVVRNNVVVGNAYGGISAQDYGGRGLQRGVWIVHNTILANQDSGINVQGWLAGAGNVLAYNAVLPVPGTPALRPMAPAGTVVGNAVCTSACFENVSVAPYDLWPRIGGGLVGAAGGGGEAWRPRDDFLGVPRGEEADIGAFERSGSLADRLVGGGLARPRRVTQDVAPAPPSRLRVQ